MTNTEPQNTSGRNFLFGILAGGMLGTAVTLYFAPRLVEDLRTRIVDSARRLRHTAADHLEQVSTRLGDTVDQVASTAKDVQAEANHGGIHTPAREL